MAYKLNSKVFNKLYGVMDEKAVKLPYHVFLKLIEFCNFLIREHI